VRERKPIKPAFTVVEGLDTSQLKTRIRTYRVAMEGYGQPFLLHRQNTSDCGFDDRFKTGPGYGQQISAGHPRRVAILHVRLTSIRWWSRLCQVMFDLCHQGALDGDAQGHGRSRLRLDSFDGYRHIQYLASRLEQRLQEEYARPSTQGQA
jgi:hypothetical protein